MGRERLTQVLLLALTLGACDRAPAKESDPAPAPGAPVTGPTKVVVPTEAAPIVAPPPSSEPTDTGPGTIGSTVPSTMTDPTVGGTAPPATEPTAAARPSATTAAKPSPTTEPTTGAAVPSQKGVRVPANSPNATAPAKPDSRAPSATPETKPATRSATNPSPPSTNPPPPSKPTAQTTPPPNVPPPQIPTPAPPPATTKVIVSEKLFRIELAPSAPCKAATACVATLVVHSLDGFKVNAEYPTKFVAKASPGITVEGTGSFAVSAKTVGTMTVTFRAAQAGTARLTGAFKLSVCTDEICEIAAPAIAFDVPVSAP